MVNGKEYRLDNASWKWLSINSAQDACNTAQCLEGYLLSRVLVTGTQKTYQYKCVDRHILDGWIMTYTLLWLFEWVSLFF